MSAGKVDETYRWARTIDHTWLKDVTIGRATGYDPRLFAIAANGDACPIDNITLLTNREGPGVGAR